MSNPTKEPKYFKGGDEINAVRCPVCNTKRFVKPDEDFGCINGCKETDGDENQGFQAIHLGEIKGGE